MHMSINSSVHRVFLTTKPLAFPLDVLTQSIFRLGVGSFSTDQEACLLCGSGIATYVGIVQDNDTCS